MRVLSLHPTTTELIFALGAGHLLVGRTDHCDYPEAALKVPSIGNDAEAMQQAVAIFEPDIILLGIGQDGFRAALGPARKAIVFAPTSVHDLITCITEIAEPLGKQVEADLITHDLVAVFERVKLKCAKFKTVRVAWRQEREFVPNGLVAELIEMAGGEPYSSGTLADFSPYFVIAIGADEEYAERLAAEEEWKILPAVQNERVLHVEEWMLRPTPRIAEGAKHLAMLLHGVDVTDA